jgi:hypothetical protein
VSKHYSEEDLILYYYEERPRRADIEQHLDSCTQCATAYRELASTLKMITTPEAPERDEQYGLEVWQRIRHQLPEQEMPWWSVWLRADRLALAGAFAVFVVAAFVAGRWWSAGNVTAPAVVFLDPAKAPAAAADSNSANQAGRDRILLSSVAEHLDRSDRVLTDIMNARAGGDLSAEKRWAEDLVATNRLYRQDATDAGEHSVALVLDELERSLLEIVHTPSHATAARLDEIRRRIDAASLLFKVRVLGNELRQREGGPDRTARSLATQRS